MNETLKIEKGMALNDFLSIVADKAVNFVIHLVVAIVVFYIGRFLVRKLNAFVQTILKKRNVDPSIATFVQSASEIVLYFVLIIAVVGILGLETSSFVALFASAGVAIGMAMSGTLQNFAGGVLILTLRPYNVGDYIEAQGFAGTVRAIQMFSTLITTPDNKTIIIPNGDLSTSPINNSTLQSHRRVEWNIGISYGDNVERAREVILGMFAADPRIVDTAKAAELSLAAPMVVVGSLDDSAVTLKVRAWVEKDLYWDIYFGYNERFYTELPVSAGINFPFPQMDVHLDR